MNKEFLNIVEEYDEPSYTFNNNYIVGEDVGDWTAEEFYVTMEQFFQEVEGSRIPDAVFKNSIPGSVVKLIETFCLNHPKSWIGKLFLGQRAAKDTESPFFGLFMQGVGLDPDDDVVLIPRLKEEISIKVGATGWMDNIKLKTGIAEAFVLAAVIATYCIHQSMFKKVYGRFPTDMANFYMYVTSLPETLHPYEVTKFKKEIHKLKKDTKWLVGKRYGTKIITPKEKQLCELMDDQLGDILNVMHNSPTEQRQRRIKDRVEQFVDTSREFLKLVHKDVVADKKKETVREYMI